MSISSLVPNNYHTLGGLPAVSPDDCARLIDIVESLRGEEDIAQCIALQVFPDFPLRWTSLKRLHKDGSITMVSSFGTRTLLRQQGGDSSSAAFVWMDHPMCASMRARQPIVAIEDHDDGQAGLFVPVINRGISVGVIGCQLELPGASVLRRMASILLMAGRLVTLAVFSLTQITGKAALSLASNSHRYSSSMEGHHPVPETLTPRQKEILTLVSQGLTNHQIARDIGYSESTVRIELMAVFRYLRVHTRRDATTAARERGLLGGTPAPPPRGGGGSAAARLHTM